MNKIRGESFKPTSKPWRDEWYQLQETGLYFKIQSLKAYVQAVADGMNEVKRQIRKSPQDAIFIDQLKDIHRTIFKEVHPWAGQVRQAYEQVYIGGRTTGADSARIPRELALWEAQSKELLEAAKTPQDKVAAIAFSHARFERIHPFRDGNGRTGRAIMNHQSTAVFGNTKRPPLNREEYIKALMAAQEGNLTDLVKVLGKREGIAIPENVQYLSPYRLAPLAPDKKEYSLMQEMQASQMSQSMTNKMQKVGLSTAKTKTQKKDRGLDLSC